MIDPTLLGKALDALNFKPDIDLFASRLNRQFPRYCSFKPDPDASYIDAFTFSWSDKHFNCFPTFSCVLRVLQKIIQDKAVGVAVVPMWPTQLWYPIMTSLSSCSSTNHPSTIQESSESSCISRDNPPTAKKNESPYLSTVRQQLEDLGFTSRSIVVIVAS